jgi:linoleate 10R-lipoxygenase
VSVNTPRDPADAYRTKSVNYAYRSADGSDYNPLIPSMGKAGSPYARSVPSLRCLSPAALPDPELVFDKLLKRDEFKEHPGGISSLFFAFAEVIIHNIFNTDLRSEGWTRNKASSYLDLSPLYGSSQEEVKKIRRGDGTGRILDDVFSDSRLLYMPPAVGALLVLFNRNHNVSLPYPYISLRTCFITLEVYRRKDLLHQRGWNLQGSRALRSYRPRRPR